MKSRYSHIVSDVDGTLISFESVGEDARRCSPATIRAVQSAISDGWTFSLATGRQRRSAVAVHHDIAANGDIVCYQGGMILDATTHAVLKDERIETDIAAAAIEYFTNAGMEMRIYTEDELWVCANGNDIQFNDRRPRSAYRLTDDPMSLVETRPSTIVGVNDSPAIEAHIDAVGQMLGASAIVTRSLSHFCEVGPANAGKVKALEWLAENRGLDRQRTVAFGDGLGDVEMLDWAGLGVAVGTEIPEVIDAADEAIPGPETDGVAKRIQQLIAS